MGVIPRNTVTGFFLSTVNLTKLLPLCGSLLVKLTRLKKEKFIKGRVALGYFSKRDWVIGCGHLSNGLYINSVCGLS